MNRRGAVNKNLRPQQVLEPCHRTQTKVMESEQRPKKKKRGKNCDIHLLEIVTSAEASTSVNVFQHSLLADHLRKLCYLFPNSCIVAKKKMIFVLMTESAQSETSKIDVADPRSFKDLGMLVELLANSQTFVLVTDSETESIRIIRKTLQTKLLFEVLENQLKGCINTIFHKKVSIEDLYNGTEEVRQIAKTKTKVLKPRSRKQGVTVLKAVSGDQSFAKQKEYICLPSVQVTEDPFPKKFEVVLSNGFSRPLSQTQPLNSHPQETRLPQTNGQRLARSPRYPEFADYNDRLKTFARWRHMRPEPITLSFGGFFYTDTDDLVRCFHCGIGLRDFSDTDNPIKEHVKHSERCLHLQECLTPRERADIKRQIENENQTTATNRYRHPELQTYESRLQTFSHWPRQIMQRPEQLADAGLFYTGTDDCVRCFACDGGMKRWDPEDDPWTEHCRWFPQCPYAREKKGDAYIALVQRSARTIQNGILGAVRGSQEQEQAVSQLPEEINRLTLRDRELQKIVEELQTIVCFEMGFSEKHFKDAVEKLVQTGKRPTIEDILEVIEIDKTEEVTASVETQNDDPFEENKLLKGMIYCMKCGENEVNTLFLPCCHHRLCTTCAEPLKECNVCGKVIRQKIRTYMG